MSAFPKTLGTTEVNIEKVIAVFIGFAAIVGILWFTQNITDLRIKQDSMWFVGLGTIAMAYIGTVLVLKHIFKSELLDVILFENHTIFGKLTVPHKFLMYGGCIIFFFLGLSVINFRHEAFMAAPTFQMVDIGAFGISTMMFCAAIIEDFALIGCLLATVYSVSRYITGSPQIATAMSLIFVPLFNVIYHFGRYGTADMVGSGAVFGIALLQVISVLVFRNLLPAIAFHTSNNVGKFLVDSQFLDPILIMVFSIIGVLVFETLLFFIYYKLPQRRLMLG